MSNVKGGGGGGKTPACYKFGDLQGMSVGDSSITKLRSSASGKAKARYPDPPLEPYQDLKGGTGGPKHRGSYGSGTPNA